VCDISSIIIYSVLENENACLWEVPGIHVTHKEWVNIMYVTVKAYN